MTLATIGWMRASADEVRQTGADQPVAVRSEERVSEPTAQATEQQIRRLIAQLDAPSFASRKQATRELIARGKATIPYLVAALGEPSREVRFRVQLLLTDHHRFEDVAPHLANAAETYYGFSARAILRERAMRHIDAACGARHADKLFKFWGTSVESYRAQTKDRLDEVRTRAQTTRTIEPLLEICEKASRFSAAVERLESLSLSQDHRHSPGFAIAETLARGLRESHSGWVVFAEQYIDALEKLVRQIRLRTDSMYTIKKEVSDRATMSTSAVEYLVRILDESSRERTILSQRIGIEPTWLQQEFCGGLALADSAACHQQIGKVHIVDLLTRLLIEWPDAPSDGVVEQLIARTAETAVVGDKPKALALLDALEAYRDLSNHRGSLQADLGKRLGERLGAAAMKAPNSRVYHPARSVHDKLIKLVEMGISPEHDVFPKRLLDDYLQGADWVTTDEQRLALDRYLRILDRLDAARLSLDQPGVRRFVLAMRDCLTTKHDRLAAGGKRLESVLSAHRDESDKADAKAVGHALVEWINDTVPQ